MTRIAVVLMLAVALAGCAQDGKQGDKATPAAQAQSAPASTAKIEWPRVAAPRIDQNRAFQYVKELCAMGPRPVGSAAHKKMEDYIVSHLQGAQIEDDRFVQEAPQGKYPLRNIVAKFPGTKDGVIVLGSHYDTKMIPGFVGANDGASSTALLLAIGDQLRANMKNGKRDGLSVWLAFFDGEEAFGANIDDADGLYGSKRLAAKWKQDGSASKIKAFMLADMIGDKDLDLLSDTNSTPWLLELITAAAEPLGNQSHFFTSQRGGIIDDHIAFKDIGVPVVDLIDFEYGYQNAFWHTTEDTPDKLSAKSLGVVGDTMLQAVWMLDAR
ncbi:MAG: M28 family peptidase [Candidatus Koribacter versatilis]|uniref:M28 family peptidase n=1 Tax=Candidatus Korobacter versatilis TaxID=658062 RepID=A0A932EQE6_9BACT|nr:M28 family peptidase [Candidatus Koribacter versatilis]